MSNRSRSAVGRGFSVFWVLVWFLATPAVAQTESDSIPPVFFVGEELTYNVRYSFFDLGQIRIRTIREVRTPEYLAYEARAFIDSYSSVPFVDVHAVFENVMDSSAFSRAFTGRSRQDDYYEISHYDFEYDKNRIVMAVSRGDTTRKELDTLEISTPCQDGLSLFFYARERLFSQQAAGVPTIIKEERVETYIDFRTEKESVEIDAVDYPVDVVRFDGDADFVGFFGLTGYFEGWFSNDAARVPIMAHLQVIIGNITVELMKWERGAWVPPRASE
ncbi:MAG: DUF3108 domain-containing protein [Bacteroidota bacterium]